MPNRKPELTPSNLFFDEDQVESGFSHSDWVTVTDPDAGQTLTASVVRGPRLAVSDGWTTVSKTQSQQWLAALGTDKLVFTGTATSGPDPVTIAYMWTPAAVALDFMTAGQSLTITYTIKANDGVGNGPAAQLSFTIEGIDDPPIANPDSLGATEDTPTSYSALDLLGNDRDPEGAVLSITGAASGSGGVATFDPVTGSIAFVPDADFFGDATFTYTVSDGGKTSVGTATVAVAGVNDAPTTSAVTLLASAEEQVRAISAVELLTHAVDVDGDLLSVLGLVASAGTLVPDGVGAWNYTPALNDDTGVVFSYVIDDGHGGSVPGSATMDLTPVNDAPTVTDTTTFFSIHFVAEDVDSPTLTYAPPFAGLGPVYSDGKRTTDFIPAAQGLLTQWDLAVTDGLLITPVGYYVVLGTEDPDLWRSPRTLSIPTVAHGFGGDDSLQGGGGIDWLSGGRGADVLAGGLGSDVFVVDPSDQELWMSPAGVEGYDRVMDFVLFGAPEPGSPAPDQLAIPLSRVAPSTPFPVAGMPPGAPIEGPIEQHLINDFGLIHFFGAGGVPYAVTDPISLLAAVEYLLATDVGAAFPGMPGVPDATVAFTGTDAGGVPHTWVYSEGHMPAPADDVLVDLVGVAASGIWHPAGGLPLLPNEVILIG